ncbi:hypothetical protein AQ490_25945 [Wenjunlia vitaminophila]|uniref:Uncharacterized protein n=1 Tax=Wenjunlia vitaminophila TaxID=76728 RepID=A0A0T6LQI2_WENVI|nr:hypothetical protein [Wenjunlia vitaminophila]KRV48244.1 hypothetical protein AQ490_25945 [Wenjunlia vitaminophila]
MTEYLLTVTAEFTRSRFDPEGIDPEFRRDLGVGAPPRLPGHVADRVASGARADAPSRLTWRQARRRRRSGAPAVPTPS